MASVAVEYPGTTHVDQRISLNAAADENETRCRKKAHELELQPSHEDKVSATERLDEGLMQYGCSHYRRRCRIRAPCCNEIFSCRHCHNEAKVICSLCNTEQEVRQNCKNCGVCMGRYFCKICKLFDDDTSKEQYHCDGCGICRIGGSQNFFHCKKCGCCYSAVLRSSHPCVERACLSPAPTESQYSSFVVSIRVEERRDCSAMRAHHPQGMLGRDAGTLSVFLPHLLEVGVRYVKSVGEVQLGYCSDADATIL